MCVVGVAVLVEKLRLRELLLPRPIGDLKRGPAGLTACEAAWRPGEIL